MSEALIFASTNPQYDDRLFIELQVQYVKISSSNLGRTCCVQKLFLTFRTFFVHNTFSPCCAKRRVSDKGLPVPSNILQNRSLRHPSPLKYFDDSWWSVCGLVYLNWLLDLVIYHKLRREYMLCKANNTQNCPGWTKMSLWVKIVVILWICSVIFSCIFLNPNYFL